MLSISQCSTCHRGKSASVPMFIPINKTNGIKLTKANRQIQITEQELRKCFPSLGRLDWGQFLKPEFTYCATLLQMRITLSWDCCLARKYKLNNLLAKKAKQSMHLHIFAVGRTVQNYE